MSLKFTHNNEIIRLLKMFFGGTKNMCEQEKSVK